ncbi:MAG: ribbon-helix-helix protein, CopG family [Vulcanimicrobiota bacterium]
MRTTVNLDDDVLRALRREAERSGSSLTETVNRVLKLGLERVHPSEAKVCYSAPTFSMGRPSIDLIKSLEVASELEDEAIVSKLEMRK